MMSDNLYFPFLDGALGYDCVRCGARCCHGLGFGIGRSQLVTLIARKPAIAPFVHVGAGPLATVYDFTDDGCCFLDDRGFCGIETSDGRAAKPIVCRLFPLTRAYRVAGVLVVEPHLLYCPLEDAAAMDGRGYRVRHADVRADLDGAGDEIPLLADVRVPAGLSDAWLDEERRVLALAGEHLDDDSPVPLAVALGGERMASLWDGWRAALALGEPDFDRAVARATRPVALLASTLRAASLFTVPLDGPYPRVRARLPAQVLATAFLTALVARAFDRRPSLRTVGELFRQTAATRALLAHWPDRAASSVPLPTAPLVEIADAWARLDEKLDGTRPLGEAFTDATHDLAPSLRFVVLRSLASVRLAFQ